MLSIVLLMVDAQYKTLATVRQVAGTVLYPFQMIALAPRDAMFAVGDYFSSLSSLQKEVHQLKARQLAMAQAMQQAQMQLAENIQLRKLMDARQHVPVKSMMAEILYDARDPASRKIILNRGATHQVALGFPVIDGAGVVGQVTRVFPFTSEVTLLTDKDQAVPVQVLRNGLRSIAYGSGRSGKLDLRFVAPNADIVVGDILITSGMDGVYPAGLAVARVMQVESNAAGAFGRVVCQPLAGIDRHRQLLVLMELPQVEPRPAPEEEGKTGKKANKPVPGAAGTVPAAPPAAPQGAPR